MTRPHRKPALRNVDSLSTARDLRPRRPSIGRPPGTGATGPGRREASGLSRGRAATREALLTTADVCMAAHRPWAGCLRRSRRTWLNNARPGDGAWTLAGTCGAAAGPHTLAIGRNGQGSRFLAAAEGALSVPANGRPWLAAGPRSEPTRRAIACGNGRSGRDGEGKVLLTLRSAYLWVVPSSGRVRAGSAHQGERAGFVSLALLPGPLPGSAVSTTWPLGPHSSCRGRGRFSWRWPIGARCSPAQPWGNEPEAPTSRGNRQESCRRMTKGAA
jgi:hypothetical protein